MFLIECLSIYSRQLLKILPVSLVLFLPFQFIVYGWMLYLQEIQAVQFYHLISFFLYILLFIVLFPPYIEIALADLNDEETTFKQIFFSFIRNFGLLFLLSIVLFIFALFGVVLLLIPTFISLGIMLLLPLYCDFSNSIRDIMIKILMVMREKYIEIIASLIFIISFNLLVWYLLTNVLSYFETNHITYIILRIILNLFIFPYFYILLVRNFHPNVKTEEKLAKLRF
jgi:hypothetical protein